MVDVKELKSIELTSFTTMATGIAVLFSIISAILLSIIIGAAVPNGAGIVIYLIPTIIIGTLMYSIYNNFFEGFLYNVLAKKLKTIAVAIEDGNQIVKISTSETATMVSLIVTIQFVLLYLVSLFILPLTLSSMIQTLMYTGQSTLAYGIYQFLNLISQPTTILIMIFGVFIITFVFVLIGTYIYNMVAKSGRGIVLNLSEENGFTAIDSIDPLKLGMMFAVISGILSLITALISLFSGGNLPSLIGSIIGGFVGGFIEFYLLGLFYNFLAPTLGKIKIELIDYVIN